jgi:hypothetical protein
MRHARRARAWDPDGYLPAEPPPPQQQQYQQQQAAQQAYLRQELEVQRAQTARLELLQAQVAECLSDAEAEQQLELDQDRARQGTRDEPPPPPFDAPSFSAVSLGGDSSSVEAWGAEQPRVWRRRSSEYSSLSTEPSGAAPQPRLRAPRQLNPVLDDLVAEYSREWDIPLDEAEDGLFPDFVDLEVLSDSVLAAKMQERKRLRRQRRRAVSDKARAAARILSRLRMRQTFAKWLVQHRSSSAETRRRRRHQAMEQKLRFRLAHRAAASAFGTWKAMLEDLRAQRAKLTRTVARMKHVHLASAWNVWKARYEKVRHAQGVLMSTLVRLQRSKMGASFTTWRDNSRWLHRTKSVGKRVAGRLRNMRVNAAFARWALMIVQIKRIKSIMRQVAGRLGNLSISTAWARWYAHVSRSMKIKMAAKLVLRRFKNLAAAAAFSKWVAWTQQRVRDTQLVRKVAGRLKHRTTSGAFETWCTSVREAVRERESAARIRKAAERMVRQWILRNLAEAMRLWRMSTDNILRQRYELTKIALRWHNRQLSNAWLMLCEGCEAARAVREDEAGRAREEAKQLAVQERAASLLCGRRGFESCRHIMILWLDWAAVSGRLRRLLARGEGHHEERTLRAALEAWAAETAERRSLRRLGERLTGRLSEHAVKSALLQWHRGASIATAKRRAEGKMRKFGLSQVSLRSRAIFKGWAEVVAEKKALDHKLSTGLRRAAAGLQGAAWSRWAEIAGRMGRNRKVVASSLTKFRLRAAMLCLEEWTAFVLRQQEKQAKLRRAAMRFSRAMVVKSFGAWNEHIQVKASLHKLLGRGSKRQMERRQAVHFGAWVREMHAARHFKTVSAKIARKASRGLCWEVLAGWHGAVSEIVRLNTTLRRCSTRLANANLGQAYNRWLAAVSVDESKHHAAARFAMAAASTRSRFVFLEWAALSGKMADDKRKREDMLNKSLRRLLMRAVTLAFECWLEIFDAAQRRKEVLATALRRLKSLEVAKAYHHWRGVLIVKRKRQARAIHALLIADTRLRIKRGGSVLRPWVGWVRARKAERGKVRKGLRNCGRVAIKYYLSIWRADAQKGRQAAGAVRKMLHRHVALAFAKWWEVLDHKHARLRTLLSTLAQWADGFVIRRVFIRWASHVHRLLDEQARAFRPALAGLSPNLAARYREIVGESEFVEHPANSPGLRDYSPRPVSPLRHIDVRSSGGSDYSLRGSGSYGGGGGSGSALLGGGGGGGGSAVSSPNGSPSPSFVLRSNPSLGMSMQHSAAAAGGGGGGGSPAATTGSGSMAGGSPIADWSLEQLALARSNSNSRQGSLESLSGISPQQRSAGAAGAASAAASTSSLSGDADWYGWRNSQPNSITATASELAAQNSHLDPVTASAMARAQSLAHLKARGPPPQPQPQQLETVSLPPPPPVLAPRPRWTPSRLSSGSASASSASVSRSFGAVQSSLATTASGASYEGFAPTSAIPGAAVAPQGTARAAAPPKAMTSAELWLQQRRSGGENYR